MLRETADHLHRALLRAFPVNQDYPQEAFRREPMPEPIRHFLEKTLESRLVKVGDVAPSPWYDTQAPVVRATREAWRTALFSTARVPASAWSKTLEHAVRLVLAYLVRPAQTLTAFVFGSEDRHVETGAVLHRVEYFQTYAYLRAGVREYVTKEHLAHVNRTPFLNLITRLDRAYTAGFGADDWMRHLETLFDLMRRIPDPSGRAGVPVDLLQTFFEHKATTEITRRLQEEGGLDPDKRFDEADLYRLMTSQRRRQAPPVESRKPEAEEPDTRREPEKPSRPSGPTLSEVTRGTVDDSVPLWMRFRKDEVPGGSVTDAGPPDEEMIGDLLDDELAEAEPPAVFEAPIDSQEPSAAEEIELDEDDEVGDQDAESESGGIESDMGEEPPTTSDQRESSEPHRAPKTLGESLSGQSPPRKLADVVADALRGVPESPPQAGKGAAPGQEELQSVPLWMRFRKDSEQPLGESITGQRSPAAGGRPPKRELMDAESTDEDQPVRRQAEPRVKTPEPAAPEAAGARGDTAALPLERLERRVFGPTDPARREWFVQHLFGNSDDEYSGVLRDIVACGSWPEASRVIARSVFRKHNVNIYSEPAVAFTDAIESYFRNRE